jgi:excisionase family DNA binding protein
MLAPDRREEPLSPTSGLADGGAQRGDMTEQALVTVKELATELRLGHTKTYELVASGQLAAVRIGRSVRVTPRAVPVIRWPTCYGFWESMSGWLAVAGRAIAPCQRPPWPPYESQIESREDYDNSNIHNQPFWEVVSQEREI